MTVKRAIGIFILLGFHLNCVAQDIKIRLDNCTLEEETLANANDSFGFQVAFYAEIFDKKNLNSFKARIFDKKKRYVKYSKEIANYNPLKHNAIAFYDHDLMEMVMHLEVGDFETTFAHEMNHAILHYYCKELPTWLNEGLSEFLEDVVRIDGKYGFSLSYISKLNKVKALLKEGKTLLSTIYSRDFYRNTESYGNYKLSWAIVAYLYHADVGILFELLEEACKKGDWVIEDVYPGGVGFLEIDLRSFFLNFTPN